MKTKKKNRGKEEERRGGGGGGAAAGERGGAETPETGDVRGCQCEVIDCRPLFLSLLLTHSTTGWLQLTG